ncbi:MAG: hypothetical protein JTT11_08890, partial [Candidatus Brockarchaeota archaeon]|nr:hypothetical protein [Candidatus Brockarchaeota archaeon]
MTSMIQDAWLLGASSLPPERRFSCYAAMNRLMELGGRAAWVLRPSRCVSRGKKVPIAAGDFLVEGGEALSIVRRELEDLGMRVSKLGSVAKVRSEPLRPPILAFYHDFGVLGESLVDLVAACKRLGFTRFTFLTSSTVREKLPGADILFLPDCDSTVLAQGLGLGGAEAVRDFVASGGSCVAVRESGTLVASPTSTDRSVGPQSEEFQSPASTLRMINCDVLSEFREFPAPSSVYRIYETDKSVRVCPFEGEVVARIVKPSHPVMFGYSGRFKVCAGGPIFSGASGSEGLCVFEKPTGKTDHHVPEALAWRIASSRPVMISGSYKSGKVLIVGANLESPGTPWTWPMLGNAVFSSVVSKPAPPIEGERPQIQEDAFKLADSVAHHSLALRRDLSSLGLEMEILVPRLLAVLDSPAVKLWVSCSKSVPEALKAVERLARSSLDSAQTCSSVNNLRASIEALESAKDVWKVPDSVLDLLGRADSELRSILSTASRATKVLRGLAEQVSKSLTEVASLAELGATIKPDAATTRALRCSAMTVVSGLLGGAPFHSPWYDGEAGPCLNTWLVKGQEGLVAP